MEKNVSLGKILFFSMKWEVGFGEGTSGSACESVEKCCYLRLETRSVGIHTELSVLLER